jgi:hypothetical protein
MRGNLDGAGFVQGDCYPFVQRRQTLLVAGQSLAVAQEQNQSHKGEKYHNQKEHSLKGRIS